MIKPNSLSTKIFLDSGDPQETRQALEILSFLDGQTTNPSLVAKNPEAQKRLASGNKFTRTELNRFYKDVIQDISSLIPAGSVSIEVYADKNSTPDDLLSQAIEMYTWIPNAHIKFPSNMAGIKAANKFSMEGGRCNMTLVFGSFLGSLIYNATLGAKVGDIFISPFIGRLDDAGSNGMKLVEDLLQLYKNSENHVQVLAASLRNLDHLYGCFKLKADIVTAPLKLYKAWAETGFELPSENWIYDSKNLSSPSYSESLNLDKPWNQYTDKEITGPLFDAGLDKFTADWNGLVENS